MHQLVWTLHDMQVDDTKWNYASVPVEAAEINNEFQYRIVLTAEKGNPQNEMGYVAIDDVEFVETVEDCKLQPEIAKPVEPETTPQPTEPPGRKYFDYAKRHRIAYINLQ